MKQFRFLFGIVIVMIGLFIYVNKVYYPSLPIENLSAKEAIDKLNKSNRNIAEIAVEGDYIWFITSSENKGISIAEENIKQMLVSSGWEYKEKDGAGLFFEKGEKKLIATTQMWTENYVLVKIPSNYK